jgi:hypothetical protein
MNWVTLCIGVTIGVTLGAGVAGLGVGEQEIGVD